MFVLENHTCDHAAPLWTKGTQPSKGSSKGLGGRTTTHKALFFFAGDVMLHPEILREHLNQNYQN